MKGLSRVPTQRDLKTAYEALGGLSQETINEKMLAFFSQWSRFDPRLAEIWVNHARLKWKSLNPVALHYHLEKLPWPTAAGVLLEFVKKPMSSDDKKLFRFWSRIVMTNFKKESWEQFFFGQRKVGGSAMFEDARLAAAEYKKWGYLGKESLSNKNKIPLHYDSSVRAEILKDLMKNNKRVSTTLYWNAIEKSISRRQAERDLESCPGLIPRGKTKARYFDVDK